jgi:NAD(P)-dependent dehydrogenase (short-subunit alcohol dehydrogenase family)
LFDTATADGKILEIAAYNVDSNLSAPLLETDLEMFTTLWRQNSLGAFLFGREAIKHMLPQGSGTLFFTGATASLRAKPPFTAFAAAKAAVRALAQGIAREFGPQGIHVAHVVVDGGIDSPRIREQQPERVAAAGEDGLLLPEHLATNYLMLHQQPKDAWTFELDLRPWRERW